MSSLTKNDKFKCEICSCVLTSEKYLINHITKRHKNDLKFICDYDGEKFTKLIILTIN